MPFHNLQAAGRAGDEGGAGFHQLYLLTAIKNLGLFVSQDATKGFALPGIVQPQIPVINN